MRSVVGKIVLGILVAIVTTTVPHNGPNTRRPMCRGWLMANPI